MTARRYLHWVSLFLLTALTLFNCSKKNGADGDADEEKPYTILSLAVKAVSDSSVTLSWTATGDDEDEGTAASYDLRYYHQWLSFDTWDDAVAVANIPAPKVAGSAEEYTVKGLKEDSTYFFAIVACDEVDNCTNPSNCVSAMCFEDIVVEFPDSNFEAAVRHGINKPTGDIHRSDLNGLLLLEANEKGIISISGIEYCRQLIWALLNHNQISDLSPLALRPQIDFLQLVNNQVSDLTPIAEWYNAVRLILRENQIMDVSPLRHLDRLVELDLRNNQIVDLQPLALNQGLATGDTIYVTGNPLSQQSIEVHIPTMEARGATVIR